jgi:anti-sigma28 factor (negative regulator of flagellin synthesis)
MKVEGNPRPTGVDHAVRTDGVQRDRLERTSTDRLRPAVGDRVEMSPDLRLVAAALRAAAASPEIRHDVVQRMRELLDSGELGADTRQLAERMIDDLLGRP